jgi:hypothetical protein
MRKALAATVLTAAMLIAPTVIPAAVSSTANAVTLQYKCQRYDWFFGWRTRYTTDYNYVRELMNSGWTCFCIAQYP